MKVIFMGTSEFAVPSLERLIRDGHQVAAVFTQPDKPAGRGKPLHLPPVKTFALQHEIPVHQPVKIKSDEELRALFEAISPDVCVVAAYGKILPEWMLSIPRFGCINVHASLLPRYRGAAPINWAIARGERQTGVTIMQMDAGMDTGPLLAQRASAIGEQETAPQLSTRLARLGADLLAETLLLIEKGGVQAISQSDNQATYAPLLKREDGLIGWQMNARDLANHVRAFQPWPGSYTGFRRKRLIIWRAREVERGLQTDSEPGTILAIDDSGVVIASASSTALRIEEVQFEGKRRITAREFANGTRLKPGDNISQ